MTTVALRMIDIVPPWALSRFGMQCIELVELFDGEAVV